jgi:flagellar basal-body rod protein FlgB
MGRQEMVDATTSLLERVLDLRMKAHEVHVSNIANANVPNYKSKKIEFTQALDDALSNAESAPNMRAQEKALQGAVQEIRSQVYEDPNAPMSSNGNTVNMEKEQTELAKNTIAYEAAIQLINKKFAMARLALTEGAR